VAYLLLVVGHTLLHGLDLLIGLALDALGHIVRGPRVLPHRR
jgi:hypothetical protein